MSQWEDDCREFRGDVLTGQHGHWCWEYDGLPVDETCSEWPCCEVAYRTMPRKLKKFAQGKPWANRRATSATRHYQRRLYRATPAAWRRLDGSWIFESVFTVHGDER